MAKEETADKAAKKEAMAKLKVLREERKDIIAKNREVFKKQNSDTGLIKNAIKDASKTIPEIAKETGLAGNLVLYYVSAMRKYGEIIESGHTESYLKYTLP